MVFGDSTAPSRDLNQAKPRLYRQPIIPAEIAEQWDHVVWIWGRRGVRQIDKIIWKRVCGDQHLWTLGRKFFCFAKEGFRGPPIARSTAMKRTNILLGLTEWLRSLGRDRFSDVTEEEFNALIANIADGLPTQVNSLRPKRALPGRPNIDAGGIGQSHIAEIFKVIAQLEQMYAEPDSDGLHLLHDGFSFKPFESFVEVWAKARAGGRPDDQTEDLPNIVVFEYLDVSLQYIFDYSEDIIELQTQIANLEVYKRTRQRPGALQSNLAKVLLEEVNKTNSELCGPSGINYSRIALAAGINQTSIYKKVYDTLITRTHGVLRHNDKGFRQAIISELEAIRDKFDSRPPAYLHDRSKDQRAGLPFTGKNTGSATPWPIETIATSAQKSDKKSFENAVADLWTSIFLILACFLADRLDEIRHLKVDCLEEAIDGYYINGLTFKGVNGESGSPMRHPCPPVVAKAIQVAISLGSDARRKAGSSELFFGQNRVHDSVFEPSTLRKRLSRFGSRHIRADGAREYKLIPMHLRRFFVTAWVHYHSFGGKFLALQTKMGHAQLGTTVAYASRYRNADVVRAEQTKLAFNVISRFAFDGLSLDGPGLKRVRKIVALADIKVMAVEDVLGVVSRHVKETRSQIYPMPWGYCLWFCGAGKIAKCQTSSDQGSDDTWPNKKKNCKMCGGCANFLTSDIFASFWATSLQRHREILRNPRAPDLLKAAALEGEKMALRYAA